jgi:hypothetical protein
MKRSSTIRERGPSSTTIYASTAGRALLSVNRLAGIEEVFRCGVSARMRHPGRAVCQLNLLDQDGNPYRAFAKLNWGRRRLWPRMTDLRTGQVFLSHPAREWHGLDKLQVLGLAVPERLALFEQGVWRFRSAVIVRAVPPPSSIYEMLCDGSWHALPQADRMAIVDQIVDTLDRIHGGGLGWRGTSTGHFYPERTPTGGWKLWLIDCEGVHTRATRRTGERDFRKIARCLSRAGADRFTLEHLRRRVKEERRIRLKPDPAIRAGRAA